MTSTQDHVLGKRERRHSECKQKEPIHDIRIKTEPQDQPTLEIKKENESPISPNKKKARLNTTTVPIRKMYGKKVLLTDSESHTLRKTQKELHKTVHYLQQCTSVQRMFNIAQHA
jgi:hypothetical protein